MFKRITLLVLTNFAIMSALWILFLALSAAGVLPPYAELPGRYGPLLIFAAIFGFGGSFISLMLSKVIAKWTTGAQVITQPRNETEQWLFDSVARHARKLGIKMPEVAIYDAPDVNAFATGPSRSNSLVAVSTGLLQRLRRDEVDAVLAHEMSHVANGDMVTMLLLQGVLNTFVIFAARVIGGVIDAALRGRDDDGRGRGIGYYLISFVAEMVLGFGATLVVMWYSRRREFRADEGGAALAGRERMVSALRSLGRSEDSTLPASLAAFGITPRRTGLMALLSSHPPLEERIEHLQNLRVSPTSPLASLGR